MKEKRGKTIIAKNITSSINTKKGTPMPLEYSAETVKKEGESMTFTGD